jgi:serine/threonine protein phosphatase 1
MHRRSRQGHKHAVRPEDRTVADTIYAVGDVHGRYDLLQKALREIGRDSAKATVIFLGDYIDRGLQSREVVERLMHGPDRGGDSWICLKGNHEQMAWDAHQPHGNRHLWLDNGGDATLRSFGGTMPPEVLAWFHGLPARHETEQHFFAHAGIMPGVPLSAQDDATLMWIRYRFLDDPSDHGKHIVHGHTPSAFAELKANRTNLDSMAFRTGRLSVGRFDRHTKGGPTRLIEVME